MAIWLGLNAICNNTPYPDILQDVPKPLQTPIAQQTHLGWDQLFQGCIAIKCHQNIAPKHGNEW